MLFLERIRELIGDLLSRKLARSSKRQSKNCDQTGDSTSKVNPWTRDLERLNCYTRAEESDRTATGEMKIQLLMEQARLEKAKEVLKQQQHQQRITIGDAATVTPDQKAKRRTCDATLTDTKAWWGQAVATWDPEDAKNLGPQGEIKHPRQHKWFNQ